MQSYFPPLNLLQIKKNGGRSVAILSYFSNRMFNNFLRLCLRDVALRVLYFPISGFTPFNQSVNQWFSE